jgi:titin
VTGASYEVYSPPYLFKGARPTITSAPGSVGYGDNFFVQTPDAANISQVSWIALSSMTHTMEQNQRFLRLSFTQASGGLNVTAPASGNLSPPGYYMLFIVNSNGVPSVAAMMRQVTAPGAIPADPSNLVASAVSSTQINLTWTDNSNNETGFGIQRSTDGTNFTQIATVGAGVVNYSDAGLPPSTQYFYRVQALGSGGNSAFSNVANATTQAASPLPAAPSNLIGNTVSHSQVNLTWTDNSNNETGFVIQRSTNGATFTQVATVAANVRTFSNTGLSAATFYYYRVAAINSFGSSAYSNVLKVRTKVK